MAQNITRITEREIRKRKLRPYSRPEFNNLRKGYNSKLPHSALLLRTFAPVVQKIRSIIFRSNSQYQPMTSPSLDLQRSRFDATSTANVAKSRYWRKASSAAQLTQTLSRQMGNTRQIHYVVSEPSIMPTDAILQDGNASRLVRSKAMSRYSHDGLYQS